MPKVKARVRSHKIEDGRLFVTLEFNERIPKISELVTVKWGVTRSLAQNALYWKYLSWLIEHGGLKEHGHFDPQALHENLKAHFLAEKIMQKGQFVAIEEGSSAILDKSEFGEYFTKCDHFVQEFFGISTQAFWDEYKERYQLP